MKLRTEKCKLNICDEKSCQIENHLPRGNYETSSQAFERSHFTKTQINSFFQTFGLGKPLFIKSKVIFFEENNGLKFLYEKEKSMVGINTGN